MIITSKAPSSPALFKAKIPPFSELDKPDWVLQEESKNPEAGFWQVRFAPSEVKTNMPIHLLVPHQLIPALEEYLTKYRPILLGDRKTDTLLLNEAGNPMRYDMVERAVGHWTLQFAGIRTTPHMFRDSVAYKWLKEHPNDFLSLSKLLWHRNVQTTIRIYGARFNESSGANAMEAWLDKREKSKEKNNE